MSVVQRVSLVLHWICHVYVCGTESQTCITFDLSCVCSGIESQPCITFDLSCVCLWYRESNLY